LQGTGHLGAANCLTKSRAAPSESFENLRQKYTGPLSRAGISHFSVIYAAMRSFLLLALAALENKSIISRLDAGMSSGLRLVTTPLLNVTSSSTQAPPALRAVVFKEGHEVIVRPCTAPASTSIHGPWHIAATGFACSKKCLEAFDC